jgi:hypothetical protein
LVIIYEKFGNWIASIFYDDWFWSEKLTQIASFAISTVVAGSICWLIWWLYYEFVLKPYNEKVNRNQDTK